MMFGRPLLCSLLILWRLVLGFPFFDLIQAGFVFDFEALISGLVVGAVEEIIGEALHIGEFVLAVVGVLVAFAVIEFFHEFGHAVADD